ncbi:MAG TPA: response regulator [Porticoccus sp.]|nr:response regulator [Porticoccus sp.]
MMSKPRQVLVVEDNQMNLELVCYMLEEMDYEYIVAEDGAVAVDKFKKDDVSLILMDCHMAGMDGFQATQEIRRIEGESFAGRRVPIIALTANAVMGDKNKCLEIGMDDYLSKPFKFHQLQELMTKWLAIEQPFAVLSEEEQTVSEVVENENSESEDIDFQVIEGVCSDPAVIKQLIKAYFDQAQHILNEIRCAADNDDINKLKFSAHTLKSSSANLGINNVAQICHDLEHWHLEKGNLSIPLLVSRLEQEFASAVPALQNYERHCCEKS